MFYFSTSHNVYSWYLNDALGSINCKNKKTVECFLHTPLKIGDHCATLIVSLLVNLTVCVQSWFKPSYLIQTRYWIPLSQSRLCMYSVILPVMSVCSDRIRMENPQTCILSFAFGKSLTRKKIKMKIQSQLKRTIS